QAALRESVHQLLDEFGHAVPILAQPYRRVVARARKARAADAIGSADHELVTRMYLPCGLSLNRNHLAPIMSPLVSKWIGCRGIDVGSAVCLTADSTPSRVGVPDLQAAAIASSSTWVAA